MSHALDNKRTAAVTHPFASTNNTTPVDTLGGDLHQILSLSINNDAEKNGFDCLEIAARVMEIHYPGLPIAKDMRKLVNRIGQYKIKP